MTGADGVVGGSTGGTASCSVLQPTAKIPRAPPSVPSPATPDQLKKEPEWVQTEVQLVHRGIDPASYLLHDSSCVGAMTSSLAQARAQLACGTAIAAHCMQLHPA